jgi:hypothetical protein
VVEITVVQLLLEEVVADEGEVEKEEVMLVEAEDVEEVVGEVGEEEATVVEAEDVVEDVGEVGEDAEEGVETIESVVGGCISQKYFLF